MEVYCTSDPQQGTIALVVTPFLDSFLDLAAVWKGLHAGESKSPLIAGISPADVTATSRHGSPPM